MKLNEIKLFEDDEMDVVAYIEKYWDRSAKDKFFRNLIVRENGEFNYFGSMHLDGPESPLPCQFGRINNFYVENASRAFFDRNLPKEVSAVHFNSCRISTMKDVPKKLDSLVINGCDLTSIDSNVSAEAVTISNNKIKSLEGIHEKIHLHGWAMLDVGDNPVEGSVLDVLRVPGLKRLVIRFAEAGSNLSDFDNAIGILEQFVGKGPKGIIEAQRELIKHDLEDFA